MKSNNIITIVKSCPYWKNIEPGTHLTLVNASEVDKVIEKGYGTMESKGFTIMTGEEMMESAKNHPSNGVWYEHDKKYITAYKEVKGKKRELYWIDRNQCQTKDQQIDWVNQIAGKIWGDRYKFTAALKRACQDWGTW